MATEHVPVLVIGGGPVGLSLAIELAWRGIACMLVERRDGSIPLPKMNGVGARTMEFCRRWGISDRVRNAGWPGTYPRRMQYVTSLRGEQLHCIDYGSDTERKLSGNSPEHFQRCPQTWFDPILREHAKSFAGNQLFYRTQLNSFEDRGDSVLATIMDRDSGVTREVTADYLIACDGAKSGVRDMLGITMEGSAQLSFEINIYFESDQVFRPGERPSVLSWLFDGSGVWGGLSAIDGRKLWRLWLTQMPPDTDIAGFDKDRYVRAAIGEEIPFRVLGVLPWLRQQRVANEFRRGRVFLCGDALHNLTPTGGFGMNTGIQDAVDLAWKLQGVRAGWAPERLFDSYALERRPVAVRNVDEATFTFAKFLAVPKYPALCEPGREGEAARAAMSAHIAANEFEREYRNEGIVLGYRYDPSPLCVPDGTPPPEDTVTSYTQTARPGSRAPHALLADGRSTLDLFGASFVLLRLGAAAPPVEPLVNAARARKMPLAVVPIAEQHVLALYEQPLVLVRPDGHVAWRGAAVPANPQTIIDTARGAMF
ncbi:MAG: 2-polyprenyl-6-methoxyphenol hydroxylase [Betaproteobacteria bacterium]|nr:2-polyprenyl-6-methoxyphenol hydroxylase [Betaproteobacteria bacterium]